MIHRNQAFLNKVNIVLDMLLVVGVYMLASWLRLNIFDGEEGNMAAVSGRTVILASAYSLVLFLILSLFGFYNTTRTRRLAWKIRTIFLGVTLAIVIASALLFVFRLEDFSRGVLLVFYAGTLAAMIAKYALMRWVLDRVRERGYNLKHVLVIGTGKLAQQYKQDIEADPELGFNLVGFIGNRRRLPEELQEKHLGSFEMLDGELASPDIYEAVIALDPEDYTRIREIIAVCERNGVKYSVIPFYNDIIPSNPVIETIGQSKLINMRSNRLDNVGWQIVKRGADILISLAGLLVLSPLMLFIALGVKLSSPGPVLFRQTRVGFSRKEFRMLKFRSMRVSCGKPAWTNFRS